MRLGGTNTRKACRLTLKTSQSVSRTNKRLHDLLPSLLLSRPPDVAANNLAVSRAIVVYDVSRFR